MINADFVLRDTCLKLLFYNQKPKQKEINIRRALTLIHIRSRKEAKTIPFKIENEWLKIPNSSRKKLEVDLNYFKKIGEVIIEEAPYFNSKKNRTIPRNKFIFSTFKLEKDTFEELKNNYLDSLNLEMEEK